MKTEFVNPFINAVDKALETMAGVNADRKQPFIKKERSTRGDITGILGFAAKNISGSVALSFPTETILNIYETMMGTPATELNDEVEDIVGKLTNIVAGGAKMEFAELGYAYNISLPLLVSGRSNVIKHKHDSPILVVPFSVNGHTFDMEVSLQMS